MKRTLIQLDEDTYARLRRRAFEQSRSISALVRELIAKGLAPEDRKYPKRVDQFSFVGVSRSKQGKLSPVSERHDEALAEIALSRSRKK
jgi:plasmid stability protein